MKNNYYDGKFENPFIKKFMDLLHGEGGSNGRE